MILISLGIQRAFDHVQQFQGRGSSARLRRSPLSRSLRRGLRTRPASRSARPRDTFCPWDSITRAQLITMVARAAHLPDAPAGFVAPFERLQRAALPMGAQGLCRRPSGRLRGHGSRLRLLGCRDSGGSLSAALVPARLSKKSLRRGLSARRGALPGDCDTVVKFQPGRVELRRVPRD